jgi:transposase
MTVIGVDCHKATHTLVAVDATGRKLADLTVEATHDGHHAAMHWAVKHFGDDVLWGVEDVQQVAGGLQRDLFYAGRPVIRVPTKLMARVRASARTRGKSDPIDALAVARAVLREPDLPVFKPDPTSRHLKLLVDRRDDLVVQRTAAYQRVLWRVHDLDPHQAPKQILLIKWRRRELVEWLETQHCLVGKIAADEMDDVETLTVKIDRLTRRISDLVEQVAPDLLELQGCGPLSAAKIIGETGGVRRFKSEAAFAQHAGVAPVPHWSGCRVVHTGRGRTGNRQLNRALHGITITQIRIGGPGRDYYNKRIEKGETPAHARRCLKRRLTRVVYTRLHSVDTNLPDPLRDDPDTMITTPSATQSPSAPRTERAYARISPIGIAISADLPDPCSTASVDPPVRRVLS